MGPASDYGYMVYGEMMIVAEMRAEMFVINAPSFFYVLIVVLFLPHLIMMLVLVLGINGHRTTQKKSAADYADCQKSLHSEPRSINFGMGALPSAPQSPE
jgi:hypothetical protein